MKGTLHTLGNLAPFLSGLITAPIVARALGPEGRGEIAIILLVASAMQVLCAVGVPWVARSAIAAEPSRFQRWEALSIRFGVGALPVSLLLGSILTLGVPVDPVERGLLLLLLAVSAFSAARGVQTNALLSFGQQARYGLTQLIGSGLLLTCIFVFALAHRLDVTTVLLANLAALTTQVALAYVFTRPTRRKHGQDEANAESTRIPTRKLALAWMSQLADFGVTRCDLILVSIVATTSTVGLYSVAALIGQIAYAVSSTVVQASYAPVRFAAGERRLALVAQLSGLLGVISAFMSVPALLFVFPVVFGPEFVGISQFCVPVALMCLAIAAIAPSIGHGADGARSAWLLPLLYLSCFLVSLASAAFLPVEIALSVLGATLTASAWTFLTMVSPTPLWHVRPRELLKWTLGKPQ